MNGHKFTEAELAWIKDNLDVGVFRNQQNFTDVFNAIFNTDVTKQSMAQMLCRRGWSVKTKHNTNQWTSEMDWWLKEHYPECDYDFVNLAKEFNQVFNTDKSSGCVTKHLERMGVHTPRPKKGQVNHSTFKPGTPHTKELPIGTIRHNSDGRPFIKVELCNGRNIKRQGGHNYKEPYWKPLQKKIWEDNYGEVPEGYIVCSLNGNPNDTDINNIGIIDKRGTAIMAKKGWWSDNSKFTKTGAQWCNLYYTAKDCGVM